MSQSKSEKPAPPEVAEIDEARLDDIAGGRKAGETQQETGSPPPPPPPPPKFSF